MSTAPGGLLGRGFCLVIRGIMTAELVHAKGEWRRGDGFVLFVLYVGHSVAAPRASRVDEFLHMITVDFCHCRFCVRLALFHKMSDAPISCSARQRNHRPSMIASVHQTPN